MHANIVEHPMINVANYQFGLVFENLRISAGTRSLIAVQEEQSNMASKLP